MHHVILILLGCILEVQLLPGLPHPSSFGATGRASHHAAPEESASAVAAARQIWSHDDVTAACERPGGIPAWSRIYRSVFVKSAVAGNASIDGSMEALRPPCSVLHTFCRGPRAFDLSCFSQQNQTRGKERALW